MYTQILNDMYNEWLAKRHHCYRDEVGNRPCDNGAMCDRCEQPELVAEWRAIRDDFLANYEPEIDVEQLVFMMQRNDPNGEYSVADLLQNPRYYEDILRQWREDSRPNNPAWLTRAIDWLMLR